MIMDPSPHCDRAGLLRLLENKSSGDEQTLLIEHLDTCKHCQNELETIAADDWWWTRASQLIRSSDTMEVCEWTDGDSSDAQLAAKSNEQMVGSIGRGKGDDSGESSAFDDVGSSESWTLDSGGESLGVEELFAG